MLIFTKLSFCNMKWYGLYTTDCPCVCEEREAIVPFVLSLDVHFEILSSCISDTLRHAISVTVSHND